LETLIHYEKNNAVEILSQTLKQILTENTVVLCIGTDRCIGDLLGPLVGTMLEEKNFRFPVYGTLDEPIHAANISNAVKKIYRRHPTGLFVAVDASLGPKNYIGTIRIKKGPVFPGKAVGKTLPPIGDISITGIVDKSGDNSYFSIHNIRFGLVHKIAKTISDALLLATYLS